IHKYVVFVAVKNGMHHSKGFVYFSEKIKKYAPPSDSHVSNIHKTILDYFVISWVYKKPTFCENNKELSILRYSLHRPSKMLHDSYWTWK